MSVLALTPYFTDRVIALFILLVFCPLMVMGSLPRKRKP